MSGFLDLLATILPSLAMGILAGQKVRITLGGKTIPVKGRSQKASGAAAKRTRRNVSAPLPSPSLPVPEQTIKEDQPSLFTETANDLPVMLPPDASSSGAPIESGSKSVT